MKILLPFLAAAAGSVPAFAQPSQPAFDPNEQVSIPFANHRSAIRNFEAPSDDVLYLEDRQRRWYRAELAGACFNLKWAHAIGYDTRGRLSLDQGSHILVGRERCTITSLTRSEGPPRKARKKRPA
ncbi:MAG TPA: DUF6491 family protein [Allosphingosinicella sp.]